MGKQRREVISSGACAIAPVRIKEGESYPGVIGPMKMKVVDIDGVASFTIDVKDICPHCGKAKLYQLFIQPEEGGKVTYSVLYGCGLEMWVAKDGKILAVSEPCGSLVA